MKNSLLIESRLGYQSFRTVKTLEPKIYTKSILEKNRPLSRTAVVLTTKTCFVFTHFLKNLVQDLKFKYSLHIMGYGTGKCINFPIGDIVIE